MITHDDFKSYIVHVKEMASEALADGGELRPVIGVWMDAMPLLWVWPPNPKESPIDTVMLAAKICITGIGADAITMAVDTICCSQKNKLDGSQWMRGEMQVAWEADLPDKKFLTEALVIQYYDRLGDCAHVITKYDRSSGSVVYDDQEEFSNEDMEGRISESIQSFFKEETLLDQMLSMSDLAKDLDLDIEAQALGDSDVPPISMAADYCRENPKLAFIGKMCAVIKYVLMPMDCAVLLAIRDPETAEYVRRALGNDDTIHTEEL